MTSGKMGKAQKIIGFTFGILLAGYIGLVGISTVRVMTAQKPPPFSFWYFESLPSSERERAVKEYMLNKYPNRADIPDAVREIEQAGGNCAQWQYHGPGAEKHYHYECLFNFLAPMREPFLKQWRIEYFSNGTKDEIGVQDIQGWFLWMLDPNAVAYIAR